MKTASQDPGATHKDPDQPSTSGGAADPPTDAIVILGYD